MPKVGIKLLKLSHARMFSHSKILFLVPLLFITSIPTYFLNFKFFNHSSVMVERPSTTTSVGLAQARPNYHIVSSSR